MSSEELPGVELEPLPGPDGKLTPYAKSGLRTITTTRIDRPAFDSWYKNRAELMASMQSPVLSCAHPQMDLWLKIMRGLDPQLRIGQPPADTWPLTRVIPRVIPSKRGLPFTLPEGSYWIDYGAVSASMRHLPERDWTYSIAAQFPDPSRVTLGFIGKHLLSRLIFAKRFSLWSHPFFEQFKEGGMVVPDFSAWTDDPKPQSLTGERMTQHFAELGYDRGYNMIPTLAWQNREMLRRVTDMMGSLYPKVNTLYLYLNSTGVDRVPWLYSRLEDIQAHLSDLPFRYMISGVESGWGVNALGEVLPRGNYHLVAGGPWMQAQRAFGDDSERARVFRRAITQLEEWHRRENLPPLPERPDDPWASVLASL